MEYFFLIFGSVETGAAPQLARTSHVLQGLLVLSVLSLSHARSLTFALSLALSLHPSLSPSLSLSLFLFLSLLSFELCFRAIWFPCVAGGAGACRSSRSTQDTCYPRNGQARAGAT